MPFPPRSALTLAPTADASSLLAQIMPVARIVLWEAWEEPLQLISLHFGQTTRPIFAFEPSQFENGSPWEESVYPADREKLRTFLGSPDVVRTEKSIDYRLIVADGELLWVRHWLLHRSAPEAGRRRLQGMLMPIPEQKHLEWECLRVSERECNRIGQELHDDLCQTLAGLSFMMHVIGERAKKVAPDLGAEITELNTQVQGATDRVRAMAHGLFPAQLNYSTLRETLNQLARQSRTRFSVEFILELPRKLPPHSPEQIVHVYRIAQEAIGNSVRHGGATAIRLSVACLSTSLQLSIEDDGKGFPANSVRPEGIGMHVMQYRARVLGGTVTFKNLTPRGASVNLRYPAAPLPRRRLKPDQTDPS
ncbi:MAG: PAS domain-containing sensor histidine kinase [Verrucomicrobiota bacterium]